MKMKNFSNQFRKTVNDMKPDKSEIRHSVLNGGTNRKTVHVHQGFGQKFGTLLTASLSFLLVLGIIVGGGLLRGMKKPLSPGGSNYGHASNVLEDPSFRTDTETTLVHYGPPDTSADSETEPPSSGTEYPETVPFTVSEPIESLPIDTIDTADPPDNDPDIVFSYDPIDDFGTDARDEVEITDINTVAINNRTVYSVAFFDAVYTVGGIDKVGRMYAVIDDTLTFEGTDMSILKLYLILYNPQTNSVVAAKKWVMAGGIFVNSDIPGTFLVAGVSYDPSDDVYGYFGVYRVTDSVTGKPEFVLDHSYDSCRIHQITLPSDGLTPEDVFAEHLRNKKYNENYWQRLNKLTEGEEFGEILDMYGGIWCKAAETTCTPEFRRKMSDIDLSAFSDISRIPYFFGKN
ncbi:MAG: hypothetical protein PUB64_06115 [Firmicutes bacterium]|nr:hypothetical protein [Bacillota bacterium]